MSEALVPSLPGVVGEGEPWFTAAVAGLQFYEYDKIDEFGHVMPAVGDPVSLVREPGNAADRNAVEVWWKNSRKLGHLPRHVAALVAPVIDAGQPLRGYVENPGDGEAWSMVVLCVGAAGGRLHEERMEWIARDAWRELAARRDVLAERRAEAWVEAHREHRRGRAADALTAFAPLLMDVGDKVPAGQRVQPKRGSKGKLFTWWDQVPPGLATKTQLREWGLKLAPRQKPYARIGYTAHREYREYALFKVSDAVAVRPLSVAQWVAKELPAVRDCIR